MFYKNVIYQGNKAFGFLEGFWPSLLYAVVLVHPHWRVFMHHSISVRLGLNFDLATQKTLFFFFLKPFRGGLVDGLYIVILLHNPSLGVKITN